MSKRSSGPRIAAPPKGPRITTPQPATPPTMVQLGADRLFGGAREVAFGQLAPDPDQPRKYMHPERLAELSASIVQHGLLQPIVVRQAGLDRAGDMRYIVVAGGRRYAAIKLALDTLADDAARARLARIPVIINDSAEAERRVLQLIENLQREDLNGVEEARALKEIARIEGLTTVGLAGRVHRSQGYVDERLRLLRHEDVEDAVATGLLTKSAGAAIASIPAADARQEWLARARAGETIRPREVYATKPSRRRRPAPKPAPGGEPDPDLLGTIARRAMVLREGNPDLTREESFHLAAIEARDAGTLDADTAGRLFGAAARFYNPVARPAADPAPLGPVTYPADSTADPASLTPAADTAPGDDPRPARPTPDAALYPELPEPDADADAPFGYPGDPFAALYPNLPLPDLAPAAPDDAATGSDFVLDPPDRPAPVAPLADAQVDLLLRALRAVRGRLAARPDAAPPRRAELAVELRALLTLLADG
jgi:ParB family chromosome partitioning protein